MTVLDQKSFLDLETALPRCPPSRGIERARGLACQTRLYREPRPPSVKTRGRGRRRPRNRLDLAISRDRQGGSVNMAAHSIRWTVNYLRGAVPGSGDVSGGRVEARAETGIAKPDGARSEPIPRPRTRDPLDSSLSSGSNEPSHSKIRLAYPEKMPKRSPQAVRSRSGNSDLGMGRVPRTVGQ